MNGTADSIIASTGRFWATVGVYSSNIVFDGYRKGHFSAQVAMSPNVFAFPFYGMGKPSKHLMCVGCGKFRDNSQDAELCL
jgi:hypothetical protein